MDMLGLKEGRIITMNQKDKIGNIIIIPAWEWLLE